MALTESNEFELGEKAPDFNLLNTVKGDFQSLEELKGEKATVVLFICNHCPFVIHINEELVKLANDFKEKGVNLIAISSNNVATHPQDGPEKMKAVAENLNYPFPYLYDETQEVAKAYKAACTPDIYVFDSELRATYHGQLCDSRPNNGIPVTGEDLRNALDNTIINKPIPNQKPSIGCGIKWK